MRPARSGWPGKAGATTTSTFFWPLRPRATPGTSRASISASPANDWTPAIAADSQGRVYVAWDTYDKGNYDVLLFTLKKDAKVGTLRAWPIRRASRPGRTSLCDKQDRLWIAYEEGDEQWGKDYGHRQPLKHGLPKNLGLRAVHQSHRASEMPGRRQDATAGRRSRRPP